MIVKYSRAFPLAAYGINEHIGFEMEIPDDGNGLNAVELLRQMAEMSFKTAHPQIKLETPVEEVLSKEEIVANTLKAISECATKEELEEFKLLKSTNRNIFIAYNAKQVQLLSCNK
jgi:hypothetical protein